MTTRYPYRHGTTTVNVWSFGKGLPANTRSAGIQYVVSDVEAVDVKAKAQNVKIDTPLGNFSAGLAHDLAVRPGRRDELLRADHSPPAVYGGGKDCANSQPPTTNQLGSWELEVGSSISTASRARRTCALPSVSVPSIVLPSTRPVI